MAADINFELGNVWGRTRDVVVFGMGKSTLEDTLAPLAKRQSRALHPEKDARAGWYYRSDGFSFARAGVPAIWFRSGTDVIGKPPGWGDAAWETWIATRYHRPSDEVSADWDLGGLAEDARLGLALALEVGGSATPPAWYPGDEFDGARRRSMAGGD
jgi:Zn-dependent M28 family amino/carboxypeptidase